MERENKYKWLSRYVKSLMDIKNKIVHHLTYIANGAKSKDTQDVLNKQIYFDDLTGLPNKTYLMKKLEQSIKEAVANHRNVIVFLFDIDNFKTINSTFNRDFGDTLLKKFAENLKSSLHFEDRIFRFSRDEFALLIDNINITPDSIEIAEQIMQACKKPLDIGERKFYIHINMGISVYPDDGVDADTLVKNADAAMCKAKDSGMDNYCLYSSIYTVKLLEKLELENDLRSAAERDEFVIFYQPMVDTVTCRTTCLEALIRWKHPKRGLIPPDEFIPAAEKTGMIVPIGDWVIGETCRQMKIWRDRGFDSLRLSVNVSALQLHQNGFPDAIRHALRNTGFDAQYLELEITERVAVMDLNVTGQTLESLTEIGLSVSLDDFGIGYSSLEYLINLPIKSIKIDKSFINKMMTDIKIQKIINYVISSAQGLGFIVTAEGVESVEQYGFLKKCKCDRIQGYLFCKPLPADEMLKFLESDVRGNVI